MFKERVVENYCVSELKIEENLHGRNFGKYNAGTR